MLVNGRSYFTYMVGQDEKEASKQKSKGKDTWVPRQEGVCLAGELGKRQRDQRIPRRGAVDEVRGGGPRSYKHLQATARVWDLTKIKQLLGFRFV